MATLLDLTIPSAITGANAFDSVSGKVTFDSGTLAGIAGRAKVTVDDSTADIGIAAHAAVATNDYRLRLYHSGLNSITIGGGDSFTLAEIRRSSNTETRIWVYMYGNWGTRRIGIQSRNDASTFTSQYFADLGSATRIEVHARKSTNGSTADGYVELLLDDVQVAVTPGFIFYTTFNMDGLRLGDVEGIDSPTTAGIFYIGQIKATDSATLIGAALAVPDQVTGLSATPVSTTQINLSWSAAARATSYKIERESPVAGGWSTLVADTASTGTTYNNTGLTENTQYNYRISGLNSSGVGAASTAANATTDAAAAVAPSAPTLVFTPYSSEAIGIDITTVDDGGAVITHTRIEYRETLVGGAWTEIDVLAHLSSHRLRLLTAATQYDIRVRQENSAGLGSYSTTGTPTVPAQGNVTKLGYVTFATQTLVPPFYGDGAISQEDQHRLLSIPIDPLAVTNTAPVVTSTANVEQALRGVPTLYPLAVSAEDQEGNIVKLRFLSTGGTISVTQGSTTIDESSAGLNGSSDFTLTGTHAALLGTLPTIIFTGTVKGVQAITVYATDSGGLSDSDAFGVDVLNNVPVANAGSDQTAEYDDTVQLDGTGSSDADNDALTYGWSWASKPTGSTAEFSSATSASPTVTFSDEAGGTYVAQLLVHDGTEFSLADTVTITVLPRSLIGYAYSDTIPVGHVISSTPVAGAWVPGGAGVELIISLGPLLHPIPDIKGLTLAEAQSAITRAGMVAGAASLTEYSTIADGLVASQSPAAGLKVSAGTSISFSLSIGPGQTTVPNTLGLAEAEADDALEQIGLLT